MPRPPKKPKVTFRWRDDPSARVEKVRAVCNLCGAHFYSYSRNGIYPSTSSHKKSCPKLEDWREAMRALGLPAI